MSREKPQDLFHVSPPGNVESILRDGLRADSNGRIFAISDQRLANSIARDQLFMPTYALLRIDSTGLRGSSILNDEVAELTAHWHRVIYQDSIAPEFITLVGIQSTEPPPTEGDYMRLARTGMSRDDVDTYYARVRALLAKHEADSKRR